MRILTTIVLMCNLFICYSYDCNIKTFGLFLNAFAAGMNFSVLLYYVIKYFDNYKK